jgi:hypothetical protein
MIREGSSFTVCLMKYLDLVDIWQKYLKHIFSSAFQSRIFPIQTRSVNIRLLVSGICSVRAKFPVSNRKLDRMTRCTSLA